MTRPVLCRPELCIFTPYGRRGPVVGRNSSTESSTSFIFQKWNSVIKYRAAGVKEVWIVSPQKETIEVYLFGEGREEAEVYTFGDEVPVRVSNGLCKVDFAQIRRRLPDSLE